MLTYVKRSADELGEWLSTEAGFISGLCSFDGERVELEAYQLAFLQNHSRFRWVTKSRPSARGTRVGCWRLYLNPSSARGTRVGCWDERILLYVNLELAVVDKAIVYLQGAP